MDMSQNPGASAGADQPDPEQAAQDPAATATPAGAIPLGPVGADAAEPTPPGGYDQVPPTPPTGTQPAGAPTPPAGYPVPAPTPAWGHTPGWGQVPPGAAGPHAGTHAPYGWGAGAYGPGHHNPYAGWPAGGYVPPAAPPVTGPGPVRRHGALATVGAVALAATLVAGVGLGHALWPTANSAAPSGSSASGNSGSNGSSPFGNGNGNGSSGYSPFGNGSGSGSGSGNSSTGAGAPSDISGIAAKVDPALVDINTNLSYQQEEAAGTGMVLTANGEILTNNHVIDGATSISVTDVGNGKTYTAKVVGYDRSGDVAVLQLNGASGLQTITPASGTAAVGQAVVGIGNAGGTGGTPSTAGGSITALNQSITATDEGGGNSENLTGLIETNADIQPGDSGGSLVNTSGQVLGMDTAASSTSYASAGSQGYAIPIATALSVAKQIEAGNASSTIHIGGTGFLGVSVQGSSSDGSGDGSGSSGYGSGGYGGGDGSGGFGFGSGDGSGDGSGSGSSTSGAVVESTVSGDPAAQAGLQQGDVITGFDGKTITSADDLTNDLESHHPGDRVSLTWTDSSGQSHTATVTLASGPPA